MTDSVRQITITTTTTDSASPPDPDEVARRYADLGATIGNEFPYGVGEFVMPDGSPIPDGGSIATAFEKAGWLKDKNANDSLAVTEEEVGPEEEAQCLWFQWEDERPARITKGLRLFYTYQRPRREQDADGNWVNMKDDRGDLVFEPVTASLYVLMGGPSH